jgi:hypothetical protein
MTAGNIVVMAMLGAVVAIYSRGRKDERRRQRAKLSREIARAFDEAEEAARECLGMCRAVGAVEQLSDSDRTILSAEPGVWDGPCDSDLLLEKRAASRKTLRRCRRVAANGLRITREARFVLMRAVLLAAEAACRECQPGSGQEQCPALKYLEKASTPFEDNTSSQRQIGPRRPRGRAEGSSPVQKAAFREPTPRTNRADRRPRAH